MLYLNIAIGIFTFSIFLAIIGFDQLARFGGVASGVFALVFMLIELWNKWVRRSQ